MSSSNGNGGAGLEIEDTTKIPSLNNSSNPSSIADSSYELATPADPIIVDPGITRSKYDPLYPEVEELFGGGGSPAPCTLVWRDLSVHVKQKDGRMKRLVNNVSGIAKPGSLVALMGPSGAGKTTLMSALANRVPVGTITDGEISMNGRPVGDFMHRESGYMHQDDLFVDNLTVMEHLTIMARLRMDRRTTTIARRRRVNQLLRQLALYPSRYTRIGGLDGRKTLSGGERKRLAFATELLTDPGLLFCDEPTTGLDSFSAQKLVALLRANVVQGKTIICTIHQPSSELMALFDSLMLLAEGRVAYAGSASGALGFFKSLGYHCPLMYNPTDYFIKVLAMTPGSESASRHAVKSICDRFAVSDAAKELDMEIHLEFHLIENEDERPRTTRDFKSPFFFTKLLWLIYRYLLIVIRDPRIQVVRIVQKLAIALTAGLCFIGTVRLTQAGIQDVQGALFIIIAENTFSPMYGVLHMFPEEFPLFTRELGAGLYTTPIYYIARMTALLPGLLVEPTLFTLVVYWLAGLRLTAHAFGLTVLLSILVLNVAIACGLLVEPTLFTLVVYWLAGLRLTAHAFGLTVLLSILVLNVAIACGLLVEPTLFTLVVYWLAGLRLTAHAFGLTVLLSILVLNVAIACGAFFSCAFGSMPVAIAYLVPFDYALMMTSGIFVRLSSIPKFISWIRHLSWLMYSNEAMTILQWDGIDDIPCANTTEVRPCLSTGDEVLDRYDFESYRFWPDVFALLGLYAAFHLLALLALRFRTRRK